jgi:hypothetical protein
MALLIAMTQCFVKETTPMLNEERTLSVTAATIYSSLDDIKEGFRK